MNNGDHETIFSSIKQAIENEIKERDIASIGAICDRSDDYIIKVVKAQDSIMKGLRVALDLIKKVEESFYFPNKDIDIK